MDLALSFPAPGEGTSQLSPAKEASAGNTEVTTASAEVSTKEATREKREARRYDESRRKFIASAAFAALG